MYIISGLNLELTSNTVYTATPWCSCSFSQPASCTFSSSCTFSGGGQCSFSAVPPSSCGS